MKFKKFLLNLLVIGPLILCGPSIEAQEAEEASSAGGSDNFLVASMLDLGLVAGMGLSGAVIGLSTLSFATHPSEHLNNILIGGSVGVIIGVLAVAWMQANNTHSKFGANSHKQNNNSGDFTYLDKMAWHNQKEECFTKSSLHNSINLNYTFRF